MPKRVKTTVQRTVEIRSTAKLVARAGVRVVLTPKLRVRDVAAAMAFYAQAFGALEVERFTAPDGSIPHLTARIGSARFALAEASTDKTSPSPLDLGGTAVSFDLIVPNVDAMTARALQLGAKVQYPVQDYAYGLRQGRIADPFGHIWSIATPLVARRRLTTPAKQSRARRTSSRRRTDGPKSK